MPLGIRIRIEQHAFGFRAITACPARFLEVILQRARGVRMDDQPNIVLVDPHPEGIGGANDLGVPGQEVILDLLFLRRL